MYLYLLNFNNYYNRIIKKFDTLEEYAPYVIGTPQKVEFNPNDGIDTEQVVNWDLTIPDYVLVVENNEVLSRWFVIEGVRIRKGQYKLTLHRDVVADNYDEVVHAPCFIEKATLTEDNPLIYNSENMGFNEIKTSETELKDRSNSAWIVGYFARTTGDTETEMHGQIKAPPNADIEVNGPITDWPDYNMLNKTYNSSNGCNWGFSWRKEDPNEIGGYVRLDFHTDSILFGDSVNGYGSIKYGAGPIDRDVARRSINRYKDSLKKSTYAILGLSPEAIILKARGLVGKVIKYKDGNVEKYNRVGLRTIPSTESGLHLIQPGDGSLAVHTNTILTSCGIAPSYAPSQEEEYWNKGYPQVYANLLKFELVLQPVNTGLLDYSVPQNRLHTSDAPYDMFCIPYSDTLKIDNMEGKTIQPSKSLMFQVATGMAEQQGAKIYDLQLLPYCPLQNLVSMTGHIDLTPLNDVGHPGYTVIRSITGPSNVPIGVILFPTKSQFSFNLPLSEPIRIINKKIQSETEKYRLVSPNYNGQFEFNAAKNNGVDFFNVDCTYIPFQPYIHINPNFKNLYGRDFNDARGLICGGDFSLARVTDAWVNYKLNNKNYQDIFDRQIKSMEFQNNMQLVSDSLNAGLSGTATGAVGGGIIGGAIAPGVGTAVGAALGGIASAGAGLGDIFINRALRNETLDLTKDQFGYQLGNIKAMPDSIAKTTAFTNNNKIFPILEFYTCTPQERQALENKIKYNGMTVMAIGTIADYISSVPSYIKGKIIRMENVADDFHFIKSIADEVNKGIFI